MAPTLFDEKPEPGDLIEIFRGGYQHWAVYIGDGFVIHLAPPSHAGANSMMSVLYDKAKVKKEELWEVVGTDKYHINNLLDSTYEPKSPGAIVRDAQGRVGQELPYSVIQRNCEHFATELRYGKPESRQVCQARDIVLAAGAAAVVGFGVVAFASYFMGGSKEKKNHQ